MSAVTVPRTMAATSLFVTAAIVSVFFTPDQIIRTEPLPIPLVEQREILIIETIPVEEIEQAAKERILDAKKELEKEKEEELTHPQEDHIEIEKPEAENTADTEIPSIETKNKIEVPPEEKKDAPLTESPHNPTWFDKLVSKVSNITPGYLLDVMFAMSVYTFVALLLRNLYDVFTEKVAQPVRFIE